MDNQQKQFNDGIFLFYKLKNQYEENIKNEKKKILKLQELSWREKRRLFKRLKPKCINCKRTVGSIFSITRNPYVKSNKNDENTENDENIEKDEFSDARILKAYCGDRLNPCPLNIEIATNIFNVKKYLNEEEVNLTNDKIETIKYKNDLLFGYLNENDVINKFEELKEKIKSETSNYEFLLNEYNEIVNNKEKMDIIDENTKEIYGLIEKIRVTVDKYEKTDNIEYINDAVDIYINELMPKIKSNNTLKYKINYVDFNEYDNTYNLIQLPYTTEDFEANLDNKIIHLVTGLGNFRK
jgi:hypothetical protein